jgi:transposase InsO family protein
LTIRSDNGCQMTSRRFVKAMKDAGIRHERTGFNNPDADAYIERWFRTLKEETVWTREYLSFTEAKQDIVAYIDFYNTGPTSFCARLSVSQRIPSISYFKCRLIVWTYGVHYGLP